MSSSFIQKLIAFSVSVSGYAWILTLKFLSLKPKPFLSQLLNVLCGTPKIAIT